jgi:hypothetical protein
VPEIHKILIELPPPSGESLPRTPEVPRILTASEEKTALEEFCRENNGIVTVSPAESIPVFFFPVDCVELNAFFTQFC